VTNDRDNVQPKLYSSGWDLNDGIDTEDDEEVVLRVAEMHAIGKGYAIISK